MKITNKASFDQIIEELFRRYKESPEQKLLEGREELEAILIAYGIVLSEIGRHVDRLNAADAQRPTTYAGATGSGQVTSAGVVSSSSHGPILTGPIRATLTGVEKESRPNTSPALNRPPFWPDLGWWKFIRTILFGKSKEKDTHESAVTIP